MFLRQFVPGTGPPAPVCLELPPKASSHQVKVFLFPVRERPGPGQGRGI